jgi:ubiquinone/menaquinone biosynthesis C-methylase UbiE
VEEGEPNGARPGSVTKHGAQARAMRNGSEAFYDRVLEDLSRQQLIHPAMKTLVVCGGPVDRDAFLRAGFTDVTITNLDTRGSREECAPYRWAREDVENLTLKDDSADLVCVHSGLHHCASPHRGLLEMYRVARSGVLLFENRDSFLVRLGCRLGLATEYELEAVAANGCRYGGVRNTCVPNYVFRWTEREIVKTVRSFAPHVTHRFAFFHGYRLPVDRLRIQNNALARAALSIGPALGHVVEKCFPRQGNLYACYIHKPAVPADLQPWLAYAGGGIAFDAAYGKKAGRCERCEVVLRARGTGTPAVSGA